MGQGMHYAADSSSVEAQPPLLVEPMTALRQGHESDTNTVPGQQGL